MDASQTARKNNSMIPGKSIMMVTKAQDSVEWAGWTPVKCSKCSLEEWAEWEAWVVWAATQDSEEGVAKAIHLDSDD